MYLILGLGNPGPRYELTRHNIGFLIVDSLASKYQIELNQHRYYSLYGYGEIEGLRVMVAKPLTYMNESGKAAKALLAALNILPEQVIVIHDDIDLPLGKMKTKHQGGDAGQLGVRSICEWTQTDRFTRIRVGVGRPERSEDIVDYVLSPFSDEEIGTVNEVIETAIETVESTLKEFHKRNEQPEEKTGC